jgi:hypothetical protein
LLREFGTGFLTQMHTKTRKEKAGAGLGLVLYLWPKTAPDDAVVSRGCSPEVAMEKILAVINLLWLVWRGTSAIADTPLMGKGGPPHGIGAYTCKEILAQHPVGAVSG